VNATGKSGEQNVRASERAKNRNTDSGGNKKRLYKWLNRKGGASAPL
jgi:hypothetical protein